MISRAAAPTYVARIAPLRPETVWSVEGAALVERCGGRSKSLPLDRLRAIRIVGDAGTGRRAAHLTFAGARAVIPAQSLAGSRLFEDRSSQFDAFVMALEHAWGGAVDSRPHAPRAAAGWASALAWGIGLTAAGALFMIATALLSGMPTLGVALGARLLFVAILLGAALPWLGRGRAP